ncbi:hypothetical protein RFI_17079 [Reticulomyxa filosa]|uniref:Caspase family p20 domain-containing protein n=1 Tax=Reticulomyxa filosa TaxID=46433 RepID=X6N496_RETFI|nr:hypothetical protein RFI_17079 [Reticulomyxa filosa]|eukprot:ETO20137.1 hypothetical protein RFI_17079 [Reticulomyxa filosa]
MSNQTFQTLKELPNPLKESQCVLHKHELLICGGYDQRACYSYHTLKNEYKFICEYPSDVKLVGHCVLKLVDNNNKDKNQITLLSFGSNWNGENKHTLVMKYVSVWSDDNNNDENEINKSNNYNEWVAFTNNHNHPIIIGRDDNDYRGVRAVIGGRNNHLLFITSQYNNISVFDLNTFQFIKHDTLPTNNNIYYHCFVSNLGNGQGQEMVKINGEKNKQNYQMLLFCFKTGLSIEYDEDDNIFQFDQLPVCDDIASFFCYAYVCINDAILFFGGYSLNGNNSIYSKLIHKYSIRENKWTTFQNTLASRFSDCVAILSEDNTYVHIIGGYNNEFLSIHVKTEVSKYYVTIFEIECKCKDEQKKKKEHIENDVIEKHKKWMKWWNQREQKDKMEIIEKFKTMSGEQFQQKNDITYIHLSIDVYLDLHENKEGEVKYLLFLFLVLIELHYYCLEAADFEKINKENLKLQLVDMKDNIVESDEDMMKEFETNEPTFKITWIPFQQLIVVGKTKAVTNALVIMIAINEYMDNKTLSNLPNVKEKDVINFSQLFGQKLNYDVVCNPSPKMTKQDVQSFLAKLIVNYELHENTRKYDGLIVIICGHGENGNTLVYIYGNEKEKG